MYSYYKLCILNIQLGNLRSFWLTPILNICSLSLPIDYGRSRRSLLNRYSYLRLLSYPIAFGSSVNPFFWRSSCCLTIILSQLPTPAASTNFYFRDSYFYLSSLNFMLKYYLFLNPFSISTVYLCNCDIDSSNLYLILYFSSTLTSYVSSFSIFIFLSVSYVSRQL